MRWTQVEVKVPRAAADPLGLILMDLGAHGYQLSGQGDEETVTAYLPLTETAEELERRVREGLGRLRAAGLLDSVPSLTLTPVSEEDWATAWRRYYRPIEVGRRLVVVPAWEDYRGERTAVAMDPGMAFGTGDHPTTRMCLEGLDREVRPGAGVLDVGCGSGILAVAAAKLGARPVVALDIDPVAVRVAEENVRRNQVSVRVLHGGLEEREEEVVALCPSGYGIVVANIIPEVICAIAPAVHRVLAGRGLFIASGIIDSKVPAVLRHVKAVGFRHREETRSGGWACLVFGKGELR